MDSSTDIYEGGWKDSVMKQWQIDEIHCTGYNAYMYTKWEDSKWV